MPTIIVAAVIAIILIGFYVADRSSGGAPDMSSITHSGGTEKKISAKAKYERSKSVFDHKGYSGCSESGFTGMDDTVEVMSRPSGTFVYKKK